VKVDTGPDTSTQVAAWRRALDNVRSLSPRYRARYAVLLAQLERTASDRAVGAAWAAVARGDAGRAATILVGMPGLEVPEPRSGGIITVAGSGPVVGGGFQ
jgi:hypothetical protein